MTRIRKARAGAALRVALLMVGLSGCGTDRRPDYPPHLHNVVSNDDAMVSRTLSGENVKAAEILLIDYGDGKVAGVVYIVPAGGQDDLSAGRVNTLHTSFDRGYVPG